MQVLAEGSYRVLRTLVFSNHALFFFPSFSFFICICMCMCTAVHVHVEAGGQPWILFRNPYYFLETGSLMNLYLPN